MRCIENNRKLLRNCNEHKMITPTSSAASVKIKKAKTLPTAMRLTKCVASMKTPPERSKGDTIKRIGSAKNNIPRI